MGYLALYVRYAIRTWLNRLNGASVCLVMRNLEWLLMMHRLT